MGQIVIGAGLIARKFKEQNLDDHLVVFASGVSNSLEKRKEQFDREIALIEESILKYDEKIFLYFSTYSINEGITSPYVNHKLDAENLIRSKAKRHIIIRLPQLVGVVINSTLVSYFTSSIILRNKVTIFKNTKKNLLCIDDLVRITGLIMKNKDNINLTWIVKSKLSVEALDIFIEISRILGENPIYELVNSRSRELQVVPNILAENICTYNDDELDSPCYWKLILRRYVPSISEIIKHEPHTH